MKQVKVKVFNAYNIDDSDKDYYNNLGIDIFEYHNSIVKRNGTVKDKFKPLEQNIVEKDKYELDDIERSSLSMFTSSTKKAKDLYDSCKRKEQRYKNMLIFENFKDNNICDLYELDYHQCDLSPLGYCLYKYKSKTDNFECIFCNKFQEK